MPKKIIVFLLLTSLLLTGCWDKIEIEERAHISAVGIDLYEPANDKEREASNDISSGVISDEVKRQNKFVFTFAFPKESLEEVEDIILSTAGNSLYGVSRVMADRTNKELFLGHLRTVIISKDLAKDPDLFREILDGIETNELLSRRVILAMTEDSAGDIIKIQPAMQPRIGQFISELFRRKDVTSRIPSGSIGDILKDLHESGNTAIPRIIPGKNDVKIAGAAVIRNFEFIGWLGEIETAELMVFKGEVDITGGRSIEYKGHSIPVDFRPRKPKMTLVEDENNIKILVEIEGEADIKQTYFESKEDLLKVEVIKEIEDLFSEQMEDEIEEMINKIQKEFRVDILGIDRYLRQRHYKLWKQVEGDWSEIFPNIDIEVKMDTKIRRIGLVR